MSDHDMMESDKGKTVDGCINDHQLQMEFSFAKNPIDCGFHSLIRERHTIKNVGNDDAKSTVQRIK